MKESKDQITSSRWNHRVVALFLSCACGIMIFMSSCQHDPAGGPIDPGPIDTTGNPIDTNENPIDTSGTPCDPQKVYFTNEVLPILRSNCAKAGCHDAITHEKGIILDSYQSIINSDEDDLIIPFDLNGSKIFKFITESDPDKRMPPAPNQRLTADQINSIATWILQGAMDLSCDPNAGQCDTTNVTYSGYVAQLFTTNCVGCHSGGAPSGGISLNTHAGVQTVALSGRLFGAINHSSGFQPMPRGSAKLPQCTIDKINAWIHDGAPNN
ncbi:MAG: hypothetical protein M3R25_04920 [Bacteroidota bacterium]|nr:hypothetical protein [Bacteroidota bacterium]